LDVKRRFSEEQIIGFLKEAERGIPVKELCRRHGFSDASFYLWRGKFGGMDVSDAKGEGSGDRERSSQEVAGGLDARERGDA
jgi:transposase-like protein